MSAINYTAKRSLITGHSADLSYDLESEMSVLVTSAKSEKSEHTSLGGSSETVFHRQDKFWTVTTVPLSDITDSVYDKFIEFLDSVASGETFTFDAYGTIASSDNIQNAKIEGDYKVTRVSNISQSTNGVFTVSFKLRILA